MLTPACAEADLSVTSDGVVHCANWVFLPPSSWDLMTNSEFHDLLSACIGLGAAAFSIWLFVWALRRL